MFHGNVPADIAKGLQSLKQRIAASNIPSSKLDETLNIATWNIREFGKKKRVLAAIHYIAEILGQFDLIGIVELRDNLADLGRVLPILGPYWKVVYSDMIPDAGGNRERIAYVYDSRTVRFGGLAAEATPPRIKKGNEYLSNISWWRAPYLASFSAGNFDFVVMTSHIRWGSSKKARLQELTSIADWIDAKRQEKHAEDKDMLVMGDFNIENAAMAAAIEGKGLKLAKPLQQGYFGSNLAKNKRYDQILHYPIYPDNFIGKGGVLDFFDGSFKPLLPDLDKDACTYQLSDHLPLWVQISTDIDGFKLDEIIQSKK